MGRNCNIIYEFCFYILYLINSDYTVFLIKMDFDFQICRTKEFFIEFLREHKYFELELLYLHQHDYYSVFFYTFLIIY